MAKLLIIKISRPPTPVILIIEKLINLLGYLCAFNRRTLNLIGTIAECSKTGHEINTDRI